MGEDFYLDAFWEDRFDNGHDLDAGEREFNEDRDAGEGDPDEDFDEDPESRDWANGFGSDGEVDGDALASAGFGTDEDYGGYGDDGGDWW